MVAASLRRRADSRPIEELGSELIIPIELNPVCARKQQLVAQQRELPVQQRHTEAIAAARLALERQREQVRADYAHSVLGDLADAEKKRDELGHELAKATQKARQTVLAAPVSGTVQQLAVHTVGGVVTPAQPLLVIVPDD